MVPGILSIILTFLVLCSASPALQPRQILPRKPLNHIKCDKRQKLPNINRPGISLAVYESSENPIQALCAAFESNGQNTGCICHSETDTPSCQQGLTKNIYLFLTFRRFCSQHCRCSDKEVPTEVENINRPVWMNEDVRSWWYPPVENPGSNIASTDNVGLPIGGTSRAGDSVECKLSCTNADGGCGDNPNCVCKATPANQYENKGNPGFFLASCILQLTLGGKSKREVMDLPCPCNTSYVSRSCCDARGGLVWEAAELKLGVLKNLDEM